MNSTHGGLVGRLGLDRTSGFDQLRPFKVSQGLPETCRQFIAHDREGGTVVIGFAP